MSEGNRLPRVSSDSELSKLRKRKQKDASKRVELRLRSNSSVGDDRLTESEKIDQKYRTDILFNNNNVDTGDVIDTKESIIEQPLQRKGSQSESDLWSNSLADIQLKAERIRFQMQQLGNRYFERWQLSQFSRIFLDPSNVINYNSILLQHSVPPYVIYGFRRLLQIISITLTCLFGTILYAMYYSGDYPKNFEDIPNSVSKATSVIMDEWLNDLSQSFLDITNNVNLPQYDFEKPATKLLSKYGSDVLKPKHPIIIVPGLTSTSLELWQSPREGAVKDYCNNYMQKNLRSRVWGGTAMIKEVMLAPQCWLYHLMLNETTGLDPNEIKVRPVSGLSAADYLFGAFWVWGPIIENLAEIGYDSNMLHMASYDWRLPFPHLETRDGYLTRLRQDIEWKVKMSGEKVVILSHSLGSNLVLYFYQWLKHSQGIDIDEWVDTHIHSLASIGGAFLGCPKAISTFLSGEALETAIMAPPIKLMKDYVLPRPWMARFARSLLGGLYLLPMGGSTIWGNSTYAAEDASNCNQSFGNLVSFRSNPQQSIQNRRLFNCAQKGFVSVSADGAMEAVDIGVTEMTQLNEIIESLNNNTNVSKNATKSPSSSTSPLRSNTEVSPFDFGKLCCSPPTNKERETIKNLLFSDNTPQYTMDNWTQIFQTIDKQWYKKMNRFVNVSFPPSNVDLDSDAYSLPQYWANPLYSPLPKFGKLYCLYGTDLVAERSYHYTHDLNASSKYPIQIDTDLTDISNNITNGVRVVNGDGTVPLMALGYMCVRGWRDTVKNENRTRWNPNGVNIITREYADGGESMISRGTVRGGKASADHVDILGNTQLISDLLFIAAGLDDNIANVPHRVVSEIETIANNVIIP